MLKYVSICTAIAALGMGSVNAQQLRQEAVLQKMEVRGAGFDLVLAMPKSPGASIDLANTPDATILYLTGDELALPFEDNAQALRAFNSLGSPGCSFHAGGEAKIPVAIYTAPKRKTVGSAVE